MDADAADEGAADGVAADVPAVEQVAVGSGGGHLHPRVPALEVGCFEAVG